MADRLCWVEFTSRNLDESREFYTAIFDWKFCAAPMPGCEMFTTGQSNFGGEFCADNPPDHPQHVLYILVDDIDTKLAAIEAAGGKAALLKAEIPGNMGYWAQFIDPNGNLVGLYQMPENPPADWDNKPEHEASNPFCWIEFLAADLEAGKQFYGQVFGWQFQPSHVEGYATFTAGDGVGGGMSAIHHAGSPQNIMYVQVADINATLERISEAGGKTVRPRHPIGENMGFVAHFNDPHGNLVALYSYQG